jgi:site-specific recombinase XerD
LGKEGLGILDRKAVPTLKEFSEKFAAEIAIQCAAKPRTVQCYSVQMAALLNFAPLAEGCLNAIDAALISAFTAHRSEKVSPASVNRALATLRRALRMAEE